MNARIFLSLTLVSASLGIPVPNQSARAQTPLAPVLATNDPKAPERAIAIERAPTLSPDRALKATAAIAKAEQFLRSRQDKATGGWSVPTPGPDATKPLQPHLPAITALVLKGMLMDPKADPVNDEVLSKGVRYMLGFRQPDGGIYDKLLPNYNTALVLSALSRVKTPEAQAAIRPAQDFLRKVQYSENSDPGAGGNEAPKPIDKDHPFYGGVGYGKHGRPDNSNLNIFIQAMEDSDISPQDESVQRALTFLKRTQMDDRINDMPYAKGSRQGGFVYATVENAQSVDGRAGQSMAGTIEETLSDGTKASRLRCYGSMTYAGFKTYLYAELPRSDARVVAAYDWIRRNYSVDENPGIGTNGVYYYYVLFARALSSWGEPVVKTLDENNTPTGAERRWGDDLVDRLVSLQNEDGSFKSLDKRWMEDNAELITAYALVALRTVTK